MPSPLPPPLLFVPTASDSSLPCSLFTFSPTTHRTHVFSFSFHPPHRHASVIRSAEINGFISMVSPWWWIMSLIIISPGWRIMPLIRIFLFFLFFFFLQCWGSMLKKAKNARRWLAINARARSHTHVPRAPRRAGAQPSRRSDFAAVVLIKVSRWNSAQTHQHTQVQRVQKNSIIKYLMSK